MEAFCQTAPLLKSNITKSVIPNSAIAKDAIGEPFAQKHYHPRAIPKTDIAKGALGEHFAQQRYYLKGLFQKMLLLKGAFRGHFVKGAL